MWIIKRLFIIAILLVAVYRIDVLEKQVAELKARPAIVYQVDNAGGAMIGKVIGKEIVDGKYTLDCGIWEVLDYKGAVRVSKCWG